MAGPPKKNATCHPEKRHKAHGLCDTCYKRYRDSKLHPEEKRKRSRESSKRLRGRYKESVYKGCKKYQLRKYGLTIEEFHALQDEQQGLCKICGKPETRRGNLSVDHCHTTGKVRGLLCSHCNLGIGKLGDNSEGVRKALIYLLQAESGQQEGADLCLVSDKQ